MTTPKQIEANCQNALLSTGPMTISGKTIVSTNAIKHGIFTKDLILTSEIGRENEDEYSEILNNLIECLSPSNQMESLLVEKIAVDFWRLRHCAEQLGLKLEASLNASNLYLMKSIHMGIRIMKKSMKKSNTKNSS